MTLDNILEEINKAETIVILTHENPDGDAVGSSLALYNALKNYGKNPDVIIPEYSRCFEFLPGSSEIKKESDVEHYDLAISVDTATMKMLNGWGKYFDNAKTSVVIDHHGTNTMYGDYNFVNPDAPACSQILIVLLQYFNIEITKENKKFLEEVNQAGNNRYAEYFAQLICGKNLIIDYLKISLAFQNKNCIKKLDEAFTIAIEMCMKRNVSEVTPVNISAQILESICWAINSKSVLIEYLSEKICSDKADIYIADEIIYIVKSSLYHIIDRYTKYTGIKVDVIDLSDVIRILRDNNVLMTKLEGGKIVDAVKRPIKGMPDGRRFVMIRKSMLLSEGGYGNE